MYTTGRGHYGVNTSTPVHPVSVGPPEKITRFSIIGGGCFSPDNLMFVVPIMHLRSERYRSRPTPGQLAVCYEEVLMQKKSVLCVFLVGLVFFYIRSKSPTIGSGD